MKKFLVLFACLLVCGNLFAQKFAKISGKISDEKSQLVAFAVVKIVNSMDTTFSQTSASTIDGDFSFDRIKPGEYYLLVSMVGFKTKKTSNFFVTNDLELPKISIESATKQLNDVSVQAKKPFIEHQVDKTVLNIENSIVATGSTVLELLEKAPGVQIDRQKDQIKLNNKTGVQVMIDGKTSFLSGGDITALLSNMNSDQVATIELITNPSAKYDASGNAGIINIKLKRNKTYGTNGTISFTTAEGIMPNSPKDLYRLGLNVNLNHREGKWNVFGNGGIARKSNFTNTYLVRSTFADNLASILTQNFDRQNKGGGFQGKIGVDYYASEKTVFGVMMDANTVKTKLNNLSNTDIYAVENGISNLSYILQAASSSSPVSNLTANFNIKHDYNKQGKSLTFDFDYSGFSNKKNENFSANYLDHSGTSTTQSSLRNNTDANIDVYAIKTDLTLPISKKAKIETGLKSSYVITNNDFLSERFVINGWENDLGRSNNFIYKENINAIYGSFSKEWKVWQLQIGLRAEQTHSNGNSITDNKVVDRNYLSLFPTIFLNQKINKDNSIRYSFGRRVDRPNYQQLNPFVFYMDPLAVDQGNPYLKPQFTKNFQISYSHKDLSLSLSYSDTRDMITQISKQNDQTRVISVVRENLGRFQHYSADVYLPFELAKWWTFQNSIGVYYNKFNDANLEGSSYTAGKVAFNLYSSNTITLPKSFSVELSYWLNSPRVNGVEQTTNYQSAVNVGLQKAMLNKKLKLRLTMDDIFLTNYWAGKLVYQNINMNVVNHYTSRRINFSISYGFGNQNVKAARARNTATDDIKNRASGN